MFERDLWTRSIDNQAIGTGLINLKFYSLLVSAFPIFSTESMLISTNYRKLTITRDDVREGRAEKENKLFLNKFYHRRNFEKMKMPSVHAGENNFFSRVNNCIGSRGVVGIEAGVLKACRLNRRLCSWEN